MSRMRRSNDATGDDEGAAIAPAYAALEELERGLLVGFPESLENRRSYSLLTDDLTGGLYSICRWKPRIDGNIDKKNIHIIAHWRLELLGDIFN